MPIFAISTGCKNDCTVIIIIFFSHSFFEAFQITEFSHQLAYVLLADHQPEATKHHTRLYSTLMSTHSFFLITPATALHFFLQFSRTVQVPAFFHHHQRPSKNAPFEPSDGFTTSWHLRGICHSDCRDVWNHLQYGNHLYLLSQNSMCWWWCAQTTVLCLALSVPKNKENQTKIIFLSTVLNWHFTQGGFRDIWGEMRVCWWMISLKINCLCFERGRPVWRHNCCDVTTESISKTSQPLQTKHSLCPYITSHL